MAERWLRCAELAKKHSSATHRGDKVKHRKPADNWTIKDRKAGFRFIGKPIRRARRTSGSSPARAASATISTSTARPMRRWCARPIRMRASSRHRCARARKKCRACSASSPAPIASPTSSAPIPHDPLPKTKYDMKLTRPAAAPVFIGPHMLLPADKARHVGEAVAMVVAETKAQALDAAEAVEVDYEELPFVIHSEDAMAPGAPEGVGRGARQHPGRDLVRRSRGDRPGLRGRRPRGQDGLPYRPRHRRAARAARGGRALRRRHRPLHALCRLRRRGAPEERARDRARHRARQAARPLLRRRRQFRHAQPRLRRVRPGAVGGAQARPAGQIHRDALGSLSQRLPGPRPGHQGRAGARARTAASSPCAPPISAMSARARSRSRR